MGNDKSNLPIPEENSVVDYAHDITLIVVARRLDIVKSQTVNPLK